MKLKYILIAPFLSIAALAQTDMTTSPAPQAFEVPGHVPTKMFLGSDNWHRPAHTDPRDLRDR